MARKKKQKGNELTGDEWIATYSDTVTLLLTFFILLYSTATTDTEKLKALSQALQNVFSGTAATSIVDHNMYDGKVPIVGKDQENSNEVVITEKDKLYSDIKEFVANNNLSNDITITKDERGVIMQMKDTILFESGKADLLPEAKPMLDNISVFLGKIKNKIIIQGHTDNRPINTYKFENNWELSGGRAYSVLNYFISKKNISPKRVVGEMCGEESPVAPNDTPENRAKNRRVNILILTSDEE